MKRRSLGEIAYDATTEGGKQNFGPWLSAPAVVRRVHEQMAKAVERAVLRRQRKAKPPVPLPIGAEHGHAVTRTRRKAGTR